MTEARWHKATNPFGMLRHLQPDVNGRKTLLLICACLRRFGKALPRSAKTWLKQAELVADGQAPVDGLNDVLYEPAEYALEDLTHLHGVDEWVVHALFALFTVSWDDRLWMDDIVKSANTAGQKELHAQAQLVRDVFGNPFRQTRARRDWCTPDVVSLARAMYEKRAFGRMPLLADALEQAGCTDADILAHCRGPGPHVRGCWVVDLVLGKK